MASIFSYISHFPPSYPYCQMMLKSLYLFHPILSISSCLRYSIRYPSFLIVSFFPPFVSPYHIRIQLRSIYDRKWPFFLLFNLQVSLFLAVRLLKKADFCFEEYPLVRIQLTALPGCHSSYSLAFPNNCWLETSYVFVIDLFLLVVPCL